MSPLAIAQALALFLPERVVELTDSGRLNALSFLTQTAPLVWNSTLEGTAGAVITVIRSGDNSGN